VSSHDHRHAGGNRTTQRRALWIALIANALLMVVEVIAGLAFHSLALLADAVHLLTDVSGLTIAILALMLLSRPATVRHTFGMQRAEVLAAQANALFLLGTSGWIIYGSVQRLIHHEDVSGTGLLLVASGAFAVNVASAWLLHRSAGESLNMRAAFVHLASDALGSLAAMAAGVIILVWGNVRADPVASLVISVLVVWAGWRLLRDSTDVLLEGAPRGMDPTQVERALCDQPGVREVHHLHLWNIASDVPALSAHVVLVGSASMHDAQLRADQIKAMLVERFGIDHATLELECHAPDEVHISS
jgi:cobalt-zinc-cadmium efflux system protein